MSRPTVTFIETKVMTEHGEGNRITDHRWERVTIGFDDGAAMLWELAGGDAGGPPINSFDLTFRTPAETWELTDCALETRNMRCQNEFTISFQHARCVPHE